MTDRIIAIVIEHDTTDIILDEHLNALMLVRYVDSATKFNEKQILLILSQPIRTDDFESIREAIEMFGFSIMEEIINDGTLMMATSSAKMIASVDLFELYAKQKPQLTDDMVVEDFVARMIAWSYVNTRIYEIDFKK